ncbi:MAG: hypothetical protein ACT4OM_10550 [Actinomycetota bacterium]
MGDLDLDTLHLETGRHSRPEVGMSFLEAVSFTAPGEKFSDAPRSVSPVIAAFTRDLNNLVDDDDRQDLKPYIPKVIASILTDDVEDHRSWQCTDWLVRVQATTWLRAAGMPELAEELEMQDPIWSADQARKVQKVLDLGHKAVNSEAKQGAAAWTEAGEKAWAEVSPKTWESVGNGVKAAVRKTTDYGNRSALNAAVCGKRYAARDAAAEIACDVAWDAAYCIAWNVALPLGGFVPGEASDAVRQRLEPIRHHLYPLTFQLLDLMVETRRVPEEVTRDVDVVGS